MKRMLFHRRHISVFVFFHVSACILLLPCMLKSTALRVGRYTMQYFSGALENRDNLWEPRN